MISVEHLTKRYPAHTAVDDVSFDVEKGQIVGFLGPNGAGKSTTLRMITGFVAPTSGSVRIGGLDASERATEARRMIGYMPEAVPLYPEMRVGEYLAYRAKIKGVAGKERRKLVDRALTLAAVADVRDRIIGQLSKGYRQRVGLADALVANPPILVLDEPTAGLDPNQIRQVRDLVRELGKEHTIFLSTHILPEVEATCSRVLIIHRGRLVGEGAPQTLRAQITGGQTYVVEVKGDEAEVRPVLESVPGVGKVLGFDGVSSGYLRAHLEFETHDEVGADIYETVRNAGLRLRELHLEAASLEDIFAQLTVAEDADDGKADTKHNGKDDAKHNGKDDAKHNGKDDAKDDAKDDEDDEDDEDGEEKAS